MIHLVNITKSFGGRVLFQNANLQINTGDKIGLVGPNGAGKSSLFRVIVKEEGIDSGDVNFSDKTIIGYFSQTVGDMKGVSALEHVKGSAGILSVLSKKIAEYEKRLQDSADNPMSDDEMADLLDKYGEAQLEFEQRGGYDLDSRAKAILTGLGIGPDLYDRPVESFSGGWKMRIALAGILALQPDVLLMDEPTNYLDFESIVWLEEWLVQYKGALVMTSHDRDFMNRIVSKIFEVANKTVTTYSGNYDFYERERDIRLEQLKSSHQRQQDMLAKEEEFISRFAARASHAAQVQSRVKKLEKIERIEIPAEDKVIDFEFPKTQRSGDDVVKFQNLNKTYELEGGKKKEVLKNVSAIVKRLDRIALVGVNGAGKSTLLKLVCGTLQPTDGEATLGASVRLGYFSQHSLDILDKNKTVYDEIYDQIPDATIGYVRNLLGAFLFSGDDVHKKISVLSGGEKSRVVLASILANPVNFLVLDEPTNHLDIKSREVLLKAIKSFEGTVMLVSHDRHFQRSIANRVFEVENGELRIYPGSYEDYQYSKQKELKLSASKK